MRHAILEIRGERALTRYPRAGGRQLELVTRQAVVGLRSF